jgi:hypothetical protein
MKVVFSATVLLAMSATTAIAAWGLKFEVSKDGSTWQSSVDATSGQVVQFRFGVYFDADSPPTVTTISDGPGTAMALTRFTGSNRAEGFAAGDLFQNVVRTITSGSTVITQIAGSIIGTTSVTSFGSQLFLGDVPFEPYKQVYIGEVKIGGDSTPRAITLRNNTFGSGNTRGVTFYSSSSPVNKQSGAPIDDVGRFDLNATINVIPAPGALALLGLGGLVAARRRRA